MVKHVLKSFTLIELLIVISIISVLSALSLASYNDFNNRSQLSKETSQFSDVLELAKRKAYSGDYPRNGCADFLGYKVNLDNSNNTYQLILCCDISCPVPVANPFSYLIKSYSISPLVAVDKSLTFVFGPLLGNTNLSSDTTVNFSSLNGLLRIPITVFVSGAIQQGQICSNCPAATPTTAPTAVPTTLPTATPTSVLPTATPTNIPPTATATPTATPTPTPFIYCFSSSAYAGQNCTSICSKYTPAKTCAANPQEIVTSTSSTCSPNTGIPSTCSTNIPSDANPYKGCWCK